MGEFAPMHWLVVLVVVLLVFGPKRLPEIGKALGETIRAFKKSLKEGSSEGSDANTESSEPMLSKIEQKKSKETGT